MVNRELCGIYFRVNRDGKWCNVCFSDMTDGEMDIILDQMKPEMMRGMCKRLAQKLHEIGDTFGIIAK